MQGEEFGVNGVELRLEPRGRAEDVLLLAAVVVNENMPRCAVAWQVREQGGKLA